MASHALNHFEVEALRANILADAPETPVPASDVFNAFASTHYPDPVLVRTSEGLKGAKGAIIAIGIEVSAAFSVYAAWLLWHIVR